MKGRTVGLSRDFRANLWEITCDCGKKFNPPTTMLRYQVVQCPKCGKEELFDYNELKKEQKWLASTK